MTKIDRYNKWREYQNELEDEWRNSVYASIFIFVIGMLFIFLVVI